MELLNMFSDLAPISNSGYRQQLYTDPGILQGQEFLENEKKIRTIVEQNMNLNLISDCNGSESNIINSVETFTDDLNFKEGMETQDTMYNNLKDNYNTVLTAYNKLISDFQANYNGGLATSRSSPLAASEREAKFTQLKSLSSQLNMIANQLISSVKDNTNKDFVSYNNMQTAIDNVQARIKEIYKEMQDNKTRNPADVDTSLAKQDETALLTRQRYYMYIIWFIIMVVILYVTITNLVNAESSFTVLLITLVLLVCLFIFFIYNSWNAEWYDFKYKLKNLNFGIPDIPKINFNPLVSIKYTT
jgi:NADH:ubiquinone oxidoreductase subunit 3 (subunit A)